MAKMGGCNYEHNNTLQAQGKGRMTPSQFSRNNLSMGGHNDHLGGTKTPYKQPIAKGKAGR